MQVHIKVVCCSETDSWVGIDTSKILSVYKKVIFIFIYIYIYMLYYIGPYILTAHGKLSS
jgi:hypothetical protein